MWKQDLVLEQSFEQWLKDCELLGLMIILDDMKIKWDCPINLYCDNIYAISLTHNSVKHDWTKHIEVNKHFIKSGLFSTPYVFIRCQLADMLTKDWAA